MEDQIKEAITLANQMSDQFQNQLKLMQEFRERMHIPGSAAHQEQFAVRKITPIEPRRSITFDHHNPLSTPGGQISRL